MGKKKKVYQKELKIFFCKIVFFTLWTTMKRLKFSFKTLKLNILYYAISHKENCDELAKKIQLISDFHNSFSAKYTFFSEKTKSTQSSEPCKVY